MKNIHWQFVDGIETVNTKEIPFLRVAAVGLTNKKKFPKTLLKRFQVPIALAKNEKEEILGVAYYKPEDFAPKSPYYSYDGTFSTTGNRPTEAIDTRLVLNQSIPDQELECEDIRNIIFTLHLDHN